MKNLILFLIFLVPIHGTIAQQMITDLINMSGDKSSSPGNFVEFNQKIFFTATTENYGIEIWVSNGNENGSYLLKDINPGKNNGLQSSFSQSSVIINDVLYFIATDGNSDGEIWKTDGTKEGTVKVTKTLNSNITKLTLVGDKFYFLIKEEYSLQVWISDGSETGTKIVKENLAEWNSPTFQGKYKNLFMFTFQPYGTNNSKVWCSDGTSAGTFPITDEIDGNGAGPGGTSALTQYIEFNNEFYFVSRNYLHKTDGTYENTKTVATLTSQLISFADAIEVNGKLYFSFFEADFNRLFIWESDGTEAGTKKIYDEASDRYFIPSNLLGKDNNLIFCGFNDNGGTSLNKLSLTDYSVTFIKELQDSAENPFIFLPHSDAGRIQPISNNRIFCSLPISYSGSKGWISGYTESTTKNFEAINNVFNVIDYNGLIYFSRYYDETGSELWKSDGSESNTVIVDNINKSKYGLNNSYLVQLNSNLIFTANDGETGDEIYIYNGNTQMLKDIRIGPNGSYCRYLTAFNGEIYFASNDSIHGFELWKTDGTEVGTKIVQDIVEGTTSSYPSYFTIYKGYLYFSIYKDGFYNLCRTDGINIDFIKNLGVNDYNSTISIDNMLSSGDYLYFVTGENDLWESNGTEAGTIKLKDFSSCNKLTDVNGKMFFTASETFDLEEELWITDGTESGTKIVKNIGPEYFSSADDLIHFNGELFFTAYSAESGRELWKSDGTGDGTIQVIDINTGSQSSIKNANFCKVDNILFFSAKDDSHGIELWKTDGSESGTSLVKDINIGAEGSFPNQLASIKSLLYFQAFDAEHGSELWKSDGTDSGTLLVSDILAGGMNSSPSYVLSINDDVFFQAESVNKGRQIWKIPYNTVASVSEFSDVAEMDVFPNPCSDYIYFNSELIPEKIKIYNSYGLLISIETTNNYRINVSHLPAGLYFIKFNLDGKIIVRKVIKK